MELNVVLTQAVGLRSTPVEVKSTIEVAVLSIDNVRNALEALFWRSMRNADFNYYADVDAKVELIDPAAVMTVRRSSNNSYTGKAWELV